MSPVIALADRIQEIVHIGGYPPSCPYRMYVHSLGNIHDEFDVGVVVVVRTARDL